MLKFEVIEAAQTKWQWASVFAPKRRHATILCEEQEIQCSSSPGVVSHPANGRVYRLTGVCNQSFNIRNEHWLLASWDCWRRERKAFASHDEFLQFIRIYLECGKHQAHLIKQRISFRYSPLAVFLVHMNDIVIFLKRWETHVLNVLNLLRDAGVTIKIE